ncbi:MAG: transcription termination/antitermination protein NusG [Kiritimatiellae bacterium]|nr:transcription termination/antitermination protein NusG [Kiritimatiellia bacterium]MBP5227708.1 transcription termination/antitermination protein NusG [Kiritimatiellia bacterium]
MDKQWYVLHTLTGQELKVLKSIQARVRIEEMGEYIGEVKVPMETVSEIKNGKRTTIKRKLYPGYVLIQLALYDNPEDRNVLEPTWRFLRETPGVIGFIGGEKPMPLPQAEVDAILNQVSEKHETVKPKVQFDVGEMVKITEGPFMNYNGTVDEVDPEHGKMKVSVAIFGRTVSVELEYWKVDRLSPEEMMPSPPISPIE